MMDHVARAHESTTLSLAVSISKFSGAIDRAYDAIATMHDMHDIAFFFATAIALVYFLAKVNDEI